MVKMKANFETKNLDTSLIIFEFEEIIDRTKYEEHNGYTLKWKITGLLNLKISDKRICRQTSRIFVSFGF